MSELQHEGSQVTDFITSHKLIKVLQTLATEEGKRHLQSSALLIFMLSASYTSRFIFRTSSQKTSNPSCVHVNLITLPLMENLQLSITLWTASDVNGSENGT